VKLVEFASMTCPHCGEFEKEAGQALIDKYVKTGLVAYEFRNYVRDPFDMTASILARCAGPQGFFPMTKAMFAEQATWIGKIQQAGDARMTAIQAMPPQQQFAAYADVAALDDFAAMRGVPRAKIAQCLADQQAASKLVQMNSDAMSQYEINSTPSFLLDGEVVELDNSATVWQQLEPKIRAAIDG
jgi:protein-disulfide isomerase